MGIFRCKQKQFPPPASSRGKQGIVLRTVAATVFACGCLATIAGGIVVQAGWYNVSAIIQHWQPTYSLIEYTVKKSVQRHARGIVPPRLDAGMVLAGRELYRINCLECHGAPGVSPGAPGKSMQPLPNPAVLVAQRWSPMEIYWIIQNGIKMSGMPAWEYRLDERDIWAIVAYLAVLPGEGAQPSAPAPLDASSQHTAGDAVRGRIALTQYACQSCHVIPGIPGSDVHVGPELKQYKERRYIAGHLPNTPENLALWIRFPRHIKPFSFMPELGVSEADARDMAAYLNGQ